MAGVPVVANKAGELYYGGKWYKSVSACVKAGAQEAWCKAALSKSKGKGGGGKGGGGKGGGGGGRVPYDVWVTLSKAEQDRIRARVRE